MLLYIKLAKDRKSSLEGFVYARDHGLREEEIIYSARLHYIDTLINAVRKGEIHG